jgi:hypothetical protein
MSAAASVVDDLRMSGRLDELVAQAAIDGVCPMCGAEGSVVGPIPLPWSEPPEVIAVMSHSDTGGTQTQSLAWIGGPFESLASVAEALLGERPVEEDEMFEDCIRELANIVAGRMQECLQAEGISMGLGLPIYISGARRLHVGTTLVKGAAMRVRFDLPGLPEIDTGFATEENA